MCNRGFTGLLAVALGVVLSTTSAIAAGSVHCGPPHRQQQAEMVSKLVARSERILLGQVIKVRAINGGEWHGTNVTFTVSVLRSLKGPDSLDPVEVRGLSEPRQFAVDPYLLDLTLRHKLGLTDPERPAFGYTGRFQRKLPSNGDNCEYVPTLDVGMSYLMFLTKPYTVISFEPIVNPQDDAWYLHVLTEVRKQDERPR